MIEIIPNLHPSAVHFPIALVVMSTLCFIFGLLLKPKYSRELLITSKWCLWFGAVFSVIAALLGWLAYDSVAHDALSHVAMTTHRNWAIPTAVFIVGIALYGCFIRHDWGKRKIGYTMLLLLIATGLISITGWLGAEVVYRHGTGVMRIPGVNGSKHGKDVPREERMAQPKAKPLHRKTKKVNGKKKGHPHRNGKGHAHSH